jgi:Zn-dependent protease
VLGDGSYLIERLAIFIPLLLSLSVHEWAHARVALMLGDDTAARMGRCTFSPLAHIDIVGTVLLPLMGAPLGWAKPVPVNPLRFDRRYSSVRGSCGS